MKHAPSKRLQAGSTLLITVIFLLIFGIIAVSTFRGSASSVQALGNMQSRNEAISAANEAINQILSTTDFSDNPSEFTKNYSYYVDANGDGVNDLVITLPLVAPDGSVTKDASIGKAGPRCVRAEPIPSKELDATKPDDVSCLGSSTGGSSGLGIATGEGGTSTVASNPSLCSNAEWSITVQATDEVTNTQVQVVQGVGVRVPTTSVVACD